MRESTVEDYLVKQVKLNGGEVRKLAWIGRSNAPDRLVMLNGKHAFIELKRPGKKPTDAQERERVRLEEAGCMASWANCHTHVDRIIDFMMDRRCPVDQMLSWF